MNESLITITDAHLQAQGFSKTFIFRFWQKIRKTDSCWLWLAAINKSGYGIITMSHSVGVIFAHRASWIINRGPIPNGLCVLHDCPGGDNPACVNPDHLWLGTRTDNAEDRDEKGRCWHPIGEASSSSKLTEIQVKEIRNLSLELSGREIARRFGVAKTTVQEVLKRRTWKHVV